ncbi:MAG: adenylyltransferase/cytidyltransferase family protein, partial [Polyangiaceae bacterium]
MGDDGLIAVYAGSFDPVTFGHLDLIVRAHAMFAHLIIAIGVHPTKRPLFSFDARVELLRRECTNRGRVRIDSF